MKKLIVYLSLVLIACAIVAIFWRQELVYALPTPIPFTYKEVTVGETITLPKAIKCGNLPVFLHFFNPDCPCSRFNLIHFKSIVTQYRKQVYFVVMVHTTEASNTSERIKKKFDLDLPVIIDKDKRIATICGVYSTPQAVIIDAKSKLYFRGNYNKARYCTDAKSNFAQMALDSLLTGTASPNLGLYATRSYGCTLPACKQ